MRQEPRACPAWLYKHAPVPPSTPQVSQPRPRSNTSLLTTTGQRARIIRHNLYGGAAVVHIVNEVGILNINVWWQPEYEHSSAAAPWVQRQWCTSSTMWVVLRSWYQCGGRDGTAPWRGGGGARC